jgi:hypothetical protein
VGLFEQIGDNETRPIAEWLPPVAATGVWFVPLFILIAQHSPWSILLAGLLGAMLAKLLRWFYPREAPSEDHVVRSHFLDAACAQAGLLYLLGGHMAGAAIFVGLSCLLIAWSADSNGHRPKRASTRLAVAIGLTALLLIHGRSAPRDGEQKASAGQGRSRTDDDLYSGVILLSESRSHVKIVAPRPARLQTSSRGGLARTITIPFSGEYWFYYWPLQRPPKSSLVQHGTPVTFKFTAMGNSFLSMQANQPIGQTLSFGCCSGIDVAISNADPFPGTVSLELMVNNTATPNVRAQSLGRAQVSSASKETLHFDMPVRGSIQEFDQILVVFRLYQPRMHRSANIAIERFDLIPRR